MILQPRQEKAKNCAKAVAFPSVYETALRLGELMDGKKKKDNLCAH